MDERQYAHTLLFLCPHCKLPVAVSVVTSKGNLEGIDSGAVKVNCFNCGKSSNVIGMMAKRHYVDDWPYSFP
jgi:hypothetical protein